MIWVLGKVFGLEKEKMIVEPNEKEGRFLLNEVMQETSDIRMNGMTGTSNRHWGGSWLISGGTCTCSGTIRARFFGVLLP